MKWIRILDARLAPCFAAIVLSGASCVSASGQSAAEGGAVVSPAKARWEQLVEIVAAEETKPEDRSDARRAIYDLDEKDHRKALIALVQHPGCWRDGMQGWGDEIGATLIRRKDPDVEQILLQRIQDDARPSLVFCLRAIQESGQESQLVSIPRAILIRNLAGLPSDPVIRAWNANAVGHSVYILAALLKKADRSNDAARENLRLLSEATRAFYFLPAIWSARAETADLNADEASVARRLFSDPATAVDLKIAVASALATKGDEPAEKWILDTIEADVNALQAAGSWATITRSGTKEQWMGFIQKRIRVLGSLGALKYVPASAATELAIAKTKAMKSEDSDVRNMFALFLASRAPDLLLQDPDLLKSFPSADRDNILGGVIFYHPELASRVAAVADQVSNRETVTGIADRFRSDGNFGDAFGLVGKEIWR